MSDKRIGPPKEGMHYFGSISIEGITEVMAVTLYNLKGDAIFEVKLDPPRTLIGEARRVARPLASPPSSRSARLCLLCAARVNAHLTPGRRGLPHPSAPGPQVRWPRSGARARRPRDDRAHCRRRCPGRAMMRHEPSSTRP